MRAEAFQPPPLPTFTSSLMWRRRDSGDIIRGHSVLDQLIMVLRTESGKYSRFVISWLTVLDLSVLKHLLTSFDFYSLVV